MKTTKSINPATGEDIATYNLYTNQEVEEIIHACNRTFQKWRRESITDRAQLMLKAAKVLRDRKEEYATMMTREMGKTLASAKAEVEKCAWVCEYYANHTTKFLADEMIETDASKSMITYQPLGVILAVMPWNFPFWQVFRFAAPALMAGNIGILKHASNVQGCALLIEQVFKEAGFPENAFRSLLISSSDVERVIENPLVKAVTLTGSEKAGTAVARTSGDQLKKTVLELGGSDAYIILEDADLEQAANQCVASRLLNAGQSCIGAKRFIILEEVYEEFLRLFIKKMASASIGDPVDDVNLGPLAREDLRNEVHDQVMKSAEKGAKIELGGQIPNRPGAYYPPTVLTNVKPGMPAYDEEIFGPVAAVIQVKNEEEAIRIANDTKYGLGACVFTQDVARGERIAKEELEAGSCFVNQFVKSDPRLPFGGIKMSGYGRELSYLGIREFTNIKTIYIR